MLAFAFMGREQQTPDGGLSALRNPFEIAPALVFAILFVTLKVITRVVESAFGQAGVVVLALLIGVADIDPFILSLVEGGRPVESLFVTAIVVSMMGNTISKGIYFGGLARQVRRESFLRYGIWALLHLPFILL